MGFKATITYVTLILTVKFGVSITHHLCETSKCALTPSDENTSRESQSEDRLLGKKHHHFSGKKINVRF